jgi:hypothetical protein
LERLIKYESDVLRFMDNALVPFTKNRGENDIRMTKVHQKVIEEIIPTRGDILISTGGNMTIDLGNKGVQIIDFGFAQTGGDLFVWDARIRSYVDRKRVYNRATRVTMVIRWALA